MPDKSTLKQSLQLLCAGLGGIAIWMYSGPLLEELARELYTQYYTLRYGAPDMFSVDYWSTFFAMRGHLGGLAYQYGNSLAALVAMPLFSKLPGLVMNDDNACPNCSETVNHVVHTDEMQISEQSTHFGLTSHPAPVLFHGLQSQPRLNSHEGQPQPLQSNHRRNLSI